MKGKQKENEDLECDIGFRRLRKALPWFGGILRGAQFVYMVSQFVKDWLL